MRMPRWSSLYGTGFRVASLPDLTPCWSHGSLCTQKVFKDEQSLAFHQTKTT